MSTYRNPKYSENLDDLFDGLLDTPKTVVTRKTRNKQQKRKAKQVIETALETGTVDRKVRAYELSRHETLAGQDITGKPIKSVSYIGSQSLQWGTKEGKLRL